MKTIYIYHEFVTKSHYTALNYLANKHGYKLRFYTFERILTFSLKSFFSILKHPIQTIFDFYFLIALPFIKSSKIVIGIAPYNKNLKFLMKLMKKHEVYFHTSYNCWDGTYCAHEPKSQELKKIWQKFTKEYVKHIFAVSQHTKQQLICNGYAEEKHISVVNHSYSIRVNTDENKGKKLKFVCVGRLVNEKGIMQLLEIFAGCAEAEITFVGKGDLAYKVIDYADKHTNIKFLGYINNFQELIPIYQENSFLLLNSQRTTRWEELFGMVIIEGMACGCVPITTDHIGPKEIISPNIDGFICHEGCIIDGIKKAIEMDDYMYKRMRGNAIEKGKSFYFESIAYRWEKIFETNSRTL